jgi:hypothetical protein
MVARLACLLVLVPAIAACGDEERVASAPGPGPDEPVSQAAPEEPPDPDVAAPASARACRRLGRRLIGVDQGDAMKHASSRGCTLRIAVQDGRALALTEDYQPARINVRVERGVVARVEFMG